MNDVCYQTHKRGCIVYAYRVNPAHGNHVFFDPASQRVAKHTMMKPATQHARVVSADHPETDTHTPRTFNIAGLREPLSGYEM